jgi:hypothetical protein
MRWARALALTLASCATTSSSWQQEAAACPSFAEFDARTRERLDALLAEAPGEVLVKEASRLNLARRTCAKHVLSELRTTRERAGLEAVQRELDAMAATYQPDDLQALMAEALGPDVEQLTPLLAEARQRTTREAGTQTANARDDAELAKLKVDAPNLLQKDLEFPETMCDAPAACERLRCVAEQHGTLDAVARACVQEAARLDGGPRAKQLGEVLALLPSTPSGVRTETLSALETLRRQVWPRVEAAVAAKRAGEAAAWASPFLALPTARQEVEGLRDAAQAHHLARAKALADFPDAAWLHRKLAEQFGGPTAAPSSRVGTWEPLRWRCQAPKPELPPLPAGLTAVLTVKCASANATPRDDPKDTLHTFELEKEMNGQRVTGTLTIACADRSNLNTLQAMDLASLPQELARQVDLNVGFCRQLHTLAATRSCTELRKQSVGELTQRFVDHARYTGKWEPCFVEWLLATEGTTPPSPPTGERVGERG